MAETRKTLIKAAISLIISICVISVFVLSVFGYTVKEKKLTGEYSLPGETDLNGNLITQHQHQTKFGVYTHTSKLNNERIVTLYSTDQINEINRQIEYGKWFYLTDSEVLYLISDTINLFQKYDKVCIVDLNGGVHVYDAQPLQKAKICEVIAYRLEVLCSAFMRTRSDGDNVCIIMNESTSSVTDDFLADKYRLVRSFYFDGDRLTENWFKVVQAELRRSQGSVFIIDRDEVFYINEISKADRLDMIVAF